MASIQILEISPTQIEDLSDDVTVYIRGGQTSALPQNVLDFLRDTLLGLAAESTDRFSATLDFLRDFYRGTPNV